MEIRDFCRLVNRVGALADREYVYVIGAAAIIPQLHDRVALEELLHTRDIDVIPDVDDATADRIAFVLGEGSNFDEQFGIYAEPVDFTTPTYAPHGWKDRTFAMNCGAVTALCMEANDLALSKYGAGREKDLSFTHGLATEGLTREATLLERLEEVRADTHHLDLMRSRIRRDFGA